MTDPNPNTPAPTSHIADPAPNGAPSPPGGAPPDPGADSAPTDPAAEREGAAGSDVDSGLAGAAAPSAAERGGAAPGLGVDSGLAGVAAEAGGAGVAVGGRWETDPRVAAVVSGAAYGALLVFGLGLGLYESFSFSWSVGSFPLAAVLISVLNFGLLWAAGWGMGGKLGAVVPAAAWLIVVMLFSGKTSSGSLVVTGTAAGNVFLLGGTLAAILAIVFTRSSGNWLIRGGMSEVRQDGG